MNFLRLVGLVIVLLGMGAGHGWADTRAEAMWKLLAVAQFPVTRDKDTRLSNLGEIVTEHRRYEIWRVRWREPLKRMAGSYRHEGNWVLVVEQTHRGPHLLGHYYVFIVQHGLWDSR